MAQNIPHTHAAKSELTLKTLAQWTLEISGNQVLADSVAKANTARHAFDPLMAEAPAVVAHVAEQARRCAQGFADHRLKVGYVIFDYEGIVVVDTEAE